MTENKGSKLRAAFTMAVGAAYGLFNESTIEGCEAAEAAIQKIAAVGNKVKRVLKKPAA